MPQAQGSSQADLGQQAHQVSPAFCHSGQPPARLVRALNQSQSSAGCRFGRGYAKMQSAPPARRRSSTWRRKGVPVCGFRNLKEEPLSVDEVRGLAAKVGGVETLFSKRAMKYRSMGLHEREVSSEEMVRLMAEEYTFVTRPVIVPRRARDGGVLRQAGGRAGEGRVIAVVGREPRLRCLVRTPPPALRRGVFVSRQGTGSRIDGGAPATSDASASGTERPSSPGRSCEISSGCKAFR